jgi:hypothetical protein
MRSAEVVTDGFGRIEEVVHEVVEGLTPEQLAFRLDADANSIAWLVWHITRIEDDHVSAVAKTEQAWTANGWFERFRLPFPPGDHGYGHSSEDVAAVRVPSGDLLTAYHDDVYGRVVGYVAGLTDPDLDRVVDRRWDPPVTLGVRLVSVIADGLQHAGQAAFTRGILGRIPAV